MGSALFFGSAIDKAIEACLKDSSVDETKVFDEHWSNVQINKREVALSQSLLVKYSLSDMEWLLLKAEDFDLLEVQAKTHDLKSLYSELTNLKNKRSPSQQSLWNFFNWLSLRRKGHLMLQTHRQEILPKIKNVQYTQKEINLDNGRGDTLIGYPDLVCTWEDNKTYIMDYKTTSYAYEKNAVSISPQLTIYSHALNIKDCGFIVFNKKISKVKTCEKCKGETTDGRIKLCNKLIEGNPCGGSLGNITLHCNIQLLLDQIPEQTEEEVLQKIEEANLGIKAKIFEKNTEMCLKQFKCPYPSLCRGGKLNEEEYEKLDGKE